MTPGEEAGIQRVYDSVKERLDSIREVATPSPPKYFSQHSLRRRARVELASVMRAMEDEWSWLREET